METVRAQFGSALEWIVAAAFLSATLAVGSLIVRELRAASTPASAPRPAVAHVDTSATPAVVPARAIAVPMLLLADGQEVRVGDALADVATRLGRAAETGTEHVDTGPRGQRITRFYEYAGTRFILVFESADTASSARVSAIYIQ
jgi:hypothetical protein